MGTGPLAPRSAPSWARVPLRKSRIVTRGPPISGAAPELSARVALAQCTVGCDAAAPPARRYQARAQAGGAPRPVSGHRGQQPCPGRATCCAWAAGRSTELLAAGPTDISPRQLTRSKTVFTGVGPVLCMHWRCAGRRVIQQPVPLHSAGLGHAADAPQPGCSRWPMPAGDEPSLLEASAWAAPAESSAWHAPAGSRHQFVLCRDPVGLLWPARAVPARAAADSGS